MKTETRHLGLRLANQFAAAGKTHFSFQEAVVLSQRSASATANLLQRMSENGLADKVRRGHYVLRALGVLGTPTIAEDIGLAAQSAFTNQAYRLAYRTALYEHDLITHPLRAVQVALSRPTRTRALSGWPLKVVLETEEILHIGAMDWQGSLISDIERTLLDAAHRPNLVGGAQALAESLAVAASQVDVDRLSRYAEGLNRNAALRRLGSLADNLELNGVSGHLTSLKPMTSDLELEPGQVEDGGWRDGRWRIRWPQPIDELHAVINQ